jgi:hypothetical protein
LCNFRANLQRGKVQISLVGGSGRTLSCVSASQIDRMHFHALTSEVPAFKHDRKMHKVSSENRTQSIKRVAEQISESEMIFKVTSPIDFGSSRSCHNSEIIFI